MKSVLDNWICIIGGSHSQVPYIKAANQLGYNTIVFDIDAYAPGAEYATIFEAFSTHDSAAILSSINKHLHQNALKGCLTSSSNYYAMMSTAKVIKEFNLYGINQIMVDVAFDKFMQKELLKQHRIPYITYIQTNSLNEARFFASKYPTTIIKPASGSAGSAGVSKIEGKKGISGAFNYAQLHSNSSNVLIEEYYEGKEYSIDGFVQNGATNILSISEKYTKEASGLILPIGYAFGCGMDESLLYKLQKLAEKVTVNLNMNNTFFSLDVIYGKKGALVLEVGLLLDAKIDTFLDFAGVNVFNKSIMLATGIPMRQDSTFNYGYAMRFLYEKDFPIDFVDNRRKCTYRNEKVILKKNNLAVAKSFQLNSTHDIFGWLLAKDTSYDAAWLKVNKGFV